MKTIKLISQAAAAMMDSGMMAELTVGTFKLSSGECDARHKRLTVSFQLQIKPSHIQHLLDMGVKIFIDTAVMADLSPKALRFKAGREAISQGDYAPYYYMGNPENAQTGVIDNWINVQAQCSVETLERLDKYCRENHTHHLAIHNNFVIRNAGWPFKMHYSSEVAVESQYNHIKAIRRTAIGVPSAKLLPIQKRVLNFKN